MVKRERLPLRGELAWLIGLLALVLLFNLVTASRSPTVWNDEVMFTDPAANQFFGRGFTSTAWPYTSPQSTWCSNAPLHTWLLVPWLHLWGFSITSVRSINFVYVTIAAALLWIAVKRIDLVRGEFWRLLLVVLFLCEYAIAFSYRSGRYDAIGILLVAALGAAATMPRGWSKSVLLALLAFWVPFAGYQLVPFMAFVLALVFIMGGRNLAVAAGVGLILGVVAVIGMIKFLDTWDTTGEVARASSVAGPITTRLVYVVDAVWHTFAGLDPSLCLIVLALSLAWTGVMGFCNREALGNGRILKGLVLIGLGVPIFMALVGHFPLYYIWMSALPLSVAVVALLSQAAGAGWIRPVGLALLILAIAVGLPLRILITLREWQQRDYSGLDAFVESNVKPGERIGADHQVFYALQRKGAIGYYPRHLASMTPEEKAGIDILIVSPADFAQFQSALGGAWKQAASWGDAGATHPGLARPYYVALYRREVP